MFRTLLLILSITAGLSHAQVATAQSRSSIEMPFEINSNRTATYPEVIAYYQRLSEHPHVSMTEIGLTDSGYPLHEIVVTNDGILDPKEVRENGKIVLMINNAIHPGEPCGVDASMLLARDLLDGRRQLLEHAVVVIIPVYNIGGALNRGSYSRANQNGPEAYGFRGNAKNLDLNRDFIKSDSKNARAFATIFHKWQPQVFIDNHTSNGADYQYVMTLIATQKDKLHPLLSAHMTEQMLPALYSKMEKKQYEMTPYVYNMHETPDQGIMGFLDLGRYSSGYAAMHHAISFMPETHMLKPYRDRVQSTYAFMESTLEYIEKEHRQLMANHQEARTLSQSQQEWVLQYELDKSKVDEINFKGFEAKYKPSEVTGADRLYYDKDAPYEKTVKYYNSYRPATVVAKPKAYVIPQAYSNIADLLLLNNVAIERLSRDTVLKSEMYYIVDYSSVSRPYEGHYLHHSLTLRSERLDVPYREGDYLVRADQPANRFIVETLEPQGPDSYFAWNFFDGILMQKEHYSAYVWEDLAAALLLSDSTIREQFLAKKNTDPGFASDAAAQLDYLYKRSPHYEPTYMRYPIGRIQAF